jgi:AcrR family transcriptional regulator
MSCDFYFGLYTICMKTLDGQDRENVSFQRARTGAQRVHRGRMIITATRELLNDLPYEAISLNKIAQRSRLSTSNILRYYDSREAILLEVFTDEAKVWLKDILGHTINPSEPLVDRLRKAANVIAETTSRYPIFCDLLHAYTVILERTTSDDAAIHFKARSFKLLRSFTEWLTKSVPELGDPRDPKVLKLVMTITLLLGALWSQSKHIQPLATRIESHVELSQLGQDFLRDTEEALFLLCKGAIN